MKNSTYRRLRKHLAYLYLFMTALVMGIIGILIFLLDHYAQVFSNQGTLRDSDFLLFYLKHELEFNLFLLAAGTALLLYLFVLLFFQNLDVLLDTVQGKPVDRLPFSYCYLPEMDMARGRIQDMLEKKQHTRQLSVQEKEHKNELLMYLAHDLKTPLTSMIGYINHILDHKVDQEQLDTSIRITYEKAQRLDDLIDEFSEILRYDDKVSQLEVTRIDLNTMLQQQLAGFYPLMEEKGIRLQLHLADHMEISGDFDKLQRVFDNLMRNAINYSIPQTEIRIAGMLYEDGVCLTYSNEGEAMDAASVQHLFDKFYRAGSARTSTSGGAGLGLAIAREIIELHQGEIKADMEGTTITFTLRLPYEQKVIL